MPRKQHNIHYIYKTTCTVTGRYYIGIHSTSNLEDGYLGSGKILRRSIRKYGKECHIKEIIAYFSNRQDLEKQEQLLVQENITNKFCMNLSNGGAGFKMNHSEKTKQQISKALLNKKYEDIHGDNASNEKEKRKASVKKAWAILSIEDRQKRKSSMRGIKGKQKNPEKKLKCPHCDLEGRGGLMKRWHFENCKLNKKQKINN